MADGLRILVIDDQSSIGQAIARLLGPGYEVALETSGTAALARIVAGDRFDACVCDVEMPPPDGGSFYDQLLRIDAELAKRLVFVSGGVAVTPRVGVPFVPKPFTRAQLVEVIAQLAPTRR